MNSFVGYGLLCDHLYLPLQETQVLGIGSFIETIRILIAIHFVANLGRDLKIKRQILMFGRESENASKEKMKHLKISRKPWNG